MKKLIFLNFLLNSTTFSETWFVAGKAGVFCHDVSFSDATYPDVDAEGPFPRMLPSWIKPAAAGSAGTWTQISSDAALGPAASCSWRGVSSPLFVLWFLCPALQRVVLQLCDVRGLAVHVS